MNEAARVLLIVLSTAAASCALLSGPHDDLLYRPHSFSRSEAAELALAKATIILEQNNYSEHSRAAAFGKLQEYIASSPEVAEFVLRRSLLEAADHPAGTVGINWFEHERERALRTLIDAQRLEYLPKYWERAFAPDLSNGQYIHWYGKAYVVSAMQWVSANRFGEPESADAQEVLIHFYRNRCDRSVTDAVLDEWLGRNCDSAGDVPGVRTYFGQLAANPAASTQQVARTAAWLGNSYFQANQLDRAAGWYAVVLRLSHRAESHATLDGSDDVFVSLYPEGQSIKSLLAEQAGDTYVSERTEARGRLELIARSGVTLTASFRDSIKAR